MKSALFYLGLSFLFTHELDAVTHSEWRLLFILRNLPETTASTVFVALHLPLFFAILWLGHHSRQAVREGTRMTLSAFLVVHAVLHFSLASNPQSEFHGALSVALFALAGICGAAYLIASWRLSGRSSAEN